MTIGQNIKRYRKLAGMSQADLADATGLSIGTIQGYEQEKYTPKILNLEKLAKALNCTIGDLSPEHLPWEHLQEVVNTLTTDPPSQRGLAIIQELNKLNEEYALVIIELFNELNEDGQEEALKRINELTRLPEYKKAP